MVGDCIQVINANCQTTPDWTKSDQTRGVPRLESRMIGPASLLHCRHWVFSDFYQCFFFGDVSFSHNLIVKFQPKLGTKRVAAVLTAEVMCASCFFCFHFSAFCLSPDL